MKRNARNPIRGNFRIAGGVICLFLGIFTLITIGHSYYLPERDYQRQGVHSIGTIRDKVIESYDVGESYHITFDYDYLENTEVKRGSGAQGVEKDFYDRVNIGDRIEVLYLRDKPTTVTIAELKPTVEARHIRWSVIFLVAGAVLIIWGKWALRRKMAREETTKPTIVYPDFPCSKEL